MQIKLKFERKRKQKRKQESLREGREATPRRCFLLLRFRFRFRFDLRLISKYTFEFLSIVVSKYSDTKLQKPSDAVGSVRTPLGTYGIFWILLHVLATWLREKKCYVKSY